MSHPIHKHMHTHITKSNAEAAIRDDKAHMTYLKEDVNKDQKYGGKYKDENQTADEKHISKLAGDVKHDEKKEGVSRRSSAKEVAYNEDHVPQREEAAGTKKEGISRRSAVDPAEAVMEGKPDTREGATKPPTKPKKG